MRLLLVGAIVAGIVIGRRMYVAWQARLRSAPIGSALVPAELLGGTDRTWVVFTTPLCGSCGPVKDQLALEDPKSGIVTVDATKEPHLAGAFGVRSAPTVLLADDRGRVRARLVGAPAVRDYLASLPETA